MTFLLYFLVQDSMLCQIVVSLRVMVCSRFYHMYCLQKYNMGKISKKNGGDPSKEVQWSIVFVLLIIACVFRQYLFC